MAALRSNPWAATVLLHPSLLSVIWNSTIREIVELAWRIESLAGLRGALRVPTGLVEAARDGKGARSKVCSRGLHELLYGSAKGSLLLHVDVN